MPDEIEQLHAVRDALGDGPAVRRAPSFSEEDKQQLTLAAKAAGLAVVRWADAYMECGYHSERYGQPGFVVLVNGLEELWNPRHFDGDALRLAVAIRAEIYHGMVVVDTDNHYLHANYDLDATPELRRAIVRVAAEIGANMQS
jgi:hypothetical protein